MSGSAACQGVPFLTLANETVGAGAAGRAPVQRGRAGVGVAVVRDPVAHHDDQAVELGDPGRVVGDRRRIVGARDEGARAAGGARAQRAAVVAAVGEGRRGDGRRADQRCQCNGELQCSGPRASRHATAAENGEHDRRGELALAAHHRDQPGAVGLREARERVVPPRSLASARFTVFLPAGDGHLVERRRAGLDVQEARLDRPRLSCPGRTRPSRWSMPFERQRVAEAVLGDSAPVDHPLGVVGRRDGDRRSERRLGSRGCRCCTPSGAVTIVFDDDAVGLMKTIVRAPTPGVVPFANSSMYVVFALST